MGTYINSSDVQSLVKNFVISSTSSVTLDELQNDIIPQIELDIHMRIQHMYDVPLSQSTSPNSFAFIKLIARRLAAAEVLDRVYTTQEGDDKVSSGFYNQAMEDLSNVAKGVIFLQDASPESEAPEKVSQMISSTTSGSNATTQRIFCQNQVF